MEFPMAAQASRLKISQIGAVTQVEFVDRNILDESNIQQISDEICGLIDDQPTPLVLIRFGNVEHLSSAALGALITINNRIKGKDGKLRLTEIDKQIREVFTITKLDKIFLIFDDADEAMASLT
jgi:anti-sigma B factor antagonist